MLSLPQRSAASAPGLRDLDLHSAGNWKVLKALAKARFSRLPGVELSFD